MDDDSRALSDRQQDRTGSMSLGAVPAGDDVSPINGDAGSSATAPPPVQDPNAKVVHDVINSDVSFEQTKALMSNSALTRT